GLVDALKQGGQTSGSSGRKRLRNSLAVSQVALALGLLICAGLFLQVFLQMAHLNVGFDPQGVLTFQLSLPPARYDSPERTALAYEEILDHLRAAPGVEAAGITSSLPASGSSVWRGYIREGDALPEPRETRHALYYPVSADYLQVMRIPLIAGRYFQQRDEALEPKVVIVNRLLAERLWPGENPVGRRIRVHTDEDFPREIVGVVGDTIYDVEDDPGPQMYVPHRQTTWSTMTVAARTSGDPYQLRAAAEAAVRSYDPNLPIYNVRSMAGIMTEQVQGFRVLSGLMGGLGTVALLLAVMGIYGVVSYSVQQRTREIGVRVALGAQRGDVLSLVLRQGALLAGIGMAIGLGIGVAVNVLLASNFPELLALKPWLLGGISLLLGLVAMTACYIPALRATRVSPMEALRYE
ncbi:MAG TPA: FtsX-like permease family protein, partial [Candidatus Acidoferrales bacterium]